MSPRSSGPRRSKSVESYLRQTRAGAALALLALAAGIASEQFAGDLWVHHPLLAGLAASAIVVVLSVAVLNEALEVRRRRRWSVVAQYVMLELVRDARMVWAAVVELAGLMPAEADPRAVDAAALAVRDTPRLTEALRGLVADADRRRALRDRVATLVVHNDEVLGRWAAVMLNADLYAEVVDRHVELAGSLAWLGGLLDQSQPSDDQLRRHRARSNAAVRITGDMDDERLAQRLVAITQLAEQLDRGTLDLAVKLVPVAWWEARLGTAARPPARIGPRP
ncbi:MAG TPA: hypothetical protein VGY13_13515 [Solirubrobacteraceae bacterium]|jgi:hypothetical protein|nr:hypothetical protein [Solirubrobacteraceae bacterium]